MINIPVKKLEEKIEPPSRTYLMDFEGLRVRGYTDGAEAVRQAVKKALLTERFWHLIYSGQYGGAIKSTVYSKNATPELIDALMPGAVKDAFAGDPRVLDVRDFEYEISGDSVMVRCIIDTVFGDVSLEELI